MTSAKWQTVFAACVILVVVLVASTAAGRGLWSSFFASLRIAKPPPVTVAIPGFSGPSATRRLQEAIGGMVADTIAATLTEADQPVANRDAASKVAGFPVLLPTRRTDQPTLIVEGAHAIAMTVDRAQLQTIFREAGDAIPLPASLNGAKFTLKTPRAVRVQYGHCPRPTDNTLQGQIQGPPPPSTDNGDCIVLTESAPASAELPPGLDMKYLVSIGLQLAGMSPNQTQAFQKMFDWESALSMSMPRSMRSYDSASVNGVPAMLVNTGGRRGPTYELFWTRNGVVFSLAGFGSSADAVPLADSVN